MLLVARPVAVFAALAGTATDFATRAFMSWFGPKGVATMTFSLLMLSDRHLRGRQIFNLAALVVFCSIIVHGLTRYPGADWIARRAERPPARASAPSQVGGYRPPRSGSMIQPITIATSTNAMNPPIRGQNIARERYTQRDRGRAAPLLTRAGDLLARRRERPRDLEPSLLAEHELQLAGRAQALRVGRTEGRAWTRSADRAQ